MSHADVVRLDASAFDPASLTGEADPYPLMKAVREHGPVVATRSGFTCVTGYAEADSALHDRRFASGPIGMRFRALLPPGAARDELEFRINFLDPPHHARVRGIVAKVFTPARVRALQPWVERRAEELLDALEPSNGSVDLRAGFAHPLPSLVISEMLGVPPADRDRLTVWTEEVTPLLGVAITEQDRVRGIAASEAFAAYTRELIAQRRAVPTEDLLTAVVNAHDAGQRLSEPELMSLVVTLYSAGHRTTRDLMINGLYALARAPDQYAMLARGEVTVQQAVQELLRFATPTLYVARVPTEAVPLGGIEIRAYSPTLILLAAANRDPAKYTAPDQLDLRRDEAPPLSFAVGPHVCLGAALARMEAEVMLAAVVRRWPTLSLAGPAPTWWGSGPFRGLDHLRVAGDAMYL
jgi:cytochrome P450